MSNDEIDVRDYVRLAWWAARRVESRWDVRAELLVGSAMLAIMRARDRYTPSGGASFLTYARKSALAAVIREAKHELQIHKNPDYQTRYLSDIEQNNLSILADSRALPDAILEVAENLSRLPHILATLAPLEKEVIVRRFGLGGSETETLESIGQSKNLTKERIRQLEANALWHLRHDLGKE